MYTANFAVTAAGELVVLETKATCVVISVPTANAVVPGAVNLIIAEVVSETRSTGSVVLPAGAEIRKAVTEAVSPRSEARNESVATAEVAVKVSPVNCVDVVEDRVNEAA
jgi:hypothetical protein